MLWKRIHFLWCGLFMGVGFLFIVAPAYCGQIDLKITEHSVSNGLRVIIVEDHSSPIISFNVWYNVGSRNERPGITGMAHLFEHMMFKGSKKYGPEEHSKLVTVNGGTDNAFTSEDTTAYFESLPRDKLELACELEADRMVNLALSPENLSSEREVVKEERRLRIDNSNFGTLEEQLAATAYKVHPYRWPVNGWMTDLDAITLEDCKAFYQTHYVPNNATVIIVGDVSPQEAVTAVEKHFGGIPPAERPVEEIPPEPLQDSERRLDYYTATQLPWLAWGFHIPAATHDDIPVLDVISNILTSGQSSRLYRRLVYEPQRALAVSSSVDKNKDPALFVILVRSIKEGHTTEEIEEALSEELEGLKEDVSPLELEKARNQLEADLIFSLQTNFVKGIQIGFSIARSGDPKFFLKRLDAYRKITPEDIKRVAVEYFSKGNRTVIRLLPKKADKE